LHRLTASFVLGYHGCDSDVAERLLDGEDFRPSTNDYDWLGHGIYFWEANPARGLEFAHEVQAREPDTIRTAAVVGAVIDLGLCLDLTTTAGIQIVRETHTEYVRLTTDAGLPLPENNIDGLRRNLDCAVINFVHEVRSKTSLEKIDSVRAIFIEGEPIYADSGFYQKSHVQICVCNPECIKGVFRVKDPSTV